MNLVERPLGRGKAGGRGARVTQSWGLNSGRATEDKDEGKNSGDICEVGR